MTIKSGFFNSVDGDRRYNAEDFNFLFDSIISEGVFKEYADAFSTNYESTTSMNIITKAGAGLFKGIWVINDDDITMELPRYPGTDTTNWVYLYYIVLEINRENRTAEIKPLLGPYYKKSSSTSYATPPTLVQNDAVWQYPIVKGFVNSVSAYPRINALYKNTSDFPYAGIKLGFSSLTSKLNSLSIGDIVYSKNGEMDLSPINKTFYPLSGQIFTNIYTSTSPVYELKSKLSDKLGDWIGSFYLQNSYVGMAETAFNRSDFISRKLCGTSNGYIVADTYYYTYDSSYRVARCETSGYNSPYAGISHVPKCFLKNFETYPTLICDDGYLYEFNVTSSAVSIVNEFQIEFPYEYSEVHLVGCYDCSNDTDDTRFLLTWSITTTSGSTGLCFSFMERTSGRQHWSMDKIYFCSSREGGSPGILSNIKLYSGEDFDQESSVSTYKRLPNDEIFAHFYTAGSVDLLSRKRMYFATFKKGADEKYYYTYKTIDTASTYYESMNIVVDDVSFIYGDNLYFFFRQFSSQGDDKYAHSIGINTMNWSTFSVGTSPIFLKDNAYTTNAENVADGNAEYQHGRNGYIATDIIIDNSLGYNSLDSSRQWIPDYPVACAHPEIYSYCYSTFFTSSNRVAFFKAYDYRSDINTVFGRAVDTDGNNLLIALSPHSESVLTGSTRTLGYTCAVINLSVSPTKTSFKALQVAASHGNISKAICFYTDRYDRPSFLFQISALSGYTLDYFYNNNILRFPIIENAYIKIKDTII